MQNLSEPLLDHRSAYDRFQSNGLFLLGSTIAFEVSGTLLLKQGLNDYRIFILAYALYFAGLYLFALCLRTIPLSIAYTTWCALGIIGVTVGSSIVYNESISVARGLCIVSTVPFVVAMYIV